LDDIQSRNEKGFGYFLTTNHMPDREKVQNNANAKQLIMQNTHTHVAYSTAPEPTQPQGTKITTRL